MLDYKIRFNTNPRYQLQTDIAEEIKKRMKPFLERKKKNIMQSCLRYKAYFDHHDRKTKTAPLETTEYRYILNPKAENQAKTLPFRKVR